MKGIKGDMGDPGVPGQSVSKIKITVSFQTNLMSAAKLLWRVCKVTIQKVSNLPEPTYTMHIIQSHTIICLIYNFMEILLE